MLIVHSLRRIAVVALVASVAASCVEVAGPATGDVPVTDRSAPSGGSQGAVIDTEPDAVSPDTVSPDTVSPDVASPDVVSDGTDPGPTGSGQQSGAATTSVAGRPTTGAAGRPELGASGADGTGGTTHGAGSRGWTVSSVRDGDTLEVSRGTRRLTVRLIGINTPETGECLSSQAAQTLRALVQDGPLRLRRDVSDRDMYGRALRYVTNAEGRDVGAQLVKRGLALSRRYPPDTARSDRYDALQARARDARRGVWAPDACGPATRADLQVSGINADAFGDDNDNLNDEWVQITNVGNSAIDMSGWEIADTSATHRYRFGAFRLSPGATFTLFSGCGRDTSSRLHWCSARGAIWNNDGDTVFVRDRNGSTVLSHSY